MRRRSSGWLALTTALALAITACGAEQGSWQPPGIEERPGGTLPATWRAGVPVRICDLEPGVGLGRPGVDPAGFCVDQPASRACAADVECRSREACVCGVCRAALCESDDECGGLSRCNFAEHRCQKTCLGAADCGADERCDAAAGLCRGRCAVDADCQGDESCVEGTCAALAGRAGACSRDADCLDRSRCAVARRPADLREPTRFGTGAGGLFVEWRDERGGASIWRAEQDAGQLRFVPRHAVITAGPEDDGRAGAPAFEELYGGFGGPVSRVVFADGKGRLRVAESTDGLEFTVSPQPLLAPSLPWQQSGLDSPSLVTLLGARSSERMVYFATRDGSALGVARWGPGAAAVAEPEPVLRTADVEDAALWHGIEGLSGPSAVALIDPLTFNTAAVRLYFAARGVESADAISFGARVPAVPNHSIGVAQSADGVHFRRWPWNPVFDRVVQLLDHRSELEPDIDPDWGTVTYRSASADGRRSDGLRVGFLDTL